MPKFSLDEQAIKSLPRPGRELWVKVANAYYEEHSDDFLAKRVGWNAVAIAGFSKAEGEHKWTSPAAQQLEDVTKNIHPFGGAPVKFMKAYTKAGKKYVQVKASGLKVDKQDERMAPSAIEDMVQACKDGKVELLDNHFSSFEMGKSVDASTNDQGEMLVDFELNDTHPNNEQLFNECAAGTCKRQASVGGNVTKAHYEYNEEMGKAVKVLDHVDLNHIAVTREGHSAYPDAEFVGAISKQVHLPEFKKGGGTMKELLEKLEKIAAEAAGFLKGTFTISPEMLDGNMTLKAEYREQLEKAAPKLEKADQARLAKALETVLKAFGIPTVMAKAKGGVSKEAMDAHAATKEALDRVGGAHEKLKEAMDAGAVPEALHEHIKEACKAYGEAVEAHQALKEAMDDSGTGMDGKEQNRSQQSASQQGDGANNPHKPGPGSSGMTAGNGSADAEKALRGAASQLLEKYKKDFEDKLAKAEENYQAVLKSGNATKEQAQKAMLEVAELKKELAKVAAQPAGPRPGAGVKVEKNDQVTSAEGHAMDAILKSVDADPNGFMSKLEGEVAQLVKMKGTKSWTAEVEKDARHKAEVLKDCKTMGPLAAMAKHGIKL